MLQVQFQNNFPCERNQPTPFEAFSKMENAMVLTNGESAQCQPHFPLAFCRWVFEIPVSYTPKLCRYYPDSMWHCFLFTYICTASNNPKRSTHVVRWNLWLNQADRIQARFQLRSRLDRGEQAREAARDYFLQMRLNESVFNRPVNMMATWQRCQQMMSLAQVHLRAHFQLHSVHRHDSKSIFPSFITHKPIHDLFETHEMPQSIF